MMHFPTILYHKDLAPTGRRVNTALEAAPMLAAGWVDTPAKFDPNYKPPPPVPEGFIEVKPGQTRPFSAFPSFRYNRFGEDLLVYSAAEAAKLDPEEWKESPADFSDDVPPLAPSRPSEPEPPALEKGENERRQDEPQRPLTAEELAAKAEEVKKHEFWATPIKIIRDALKDARDMALFDRLEAWEQDNPKGPRVGALDAIADARREAIGALSPKQG